MFDSAVTEIFKLDSALASYYLLYLLGCLGLGLLFGLFGKNFSIFGWVFWELQSASWHLVL